MNLFSSNPHLCPLLDRIIQSEPFPELTDRHALDVGIRASSEWMQAAPFTSEGLILHWFPMLQSRWVITEKESLWLAPALIDAGYATGGEAVNPTWEWRQASAGWLTDRAGLAQKDGRDQGSDEGRDLVQAGANQVSHCDD
jgi:hypothetical protein